MPRNDEIIRQLKLARNNINFYESELQRINALKKEEKINIYDLIGELTDAN